MILTNYGLEIDRNARCIVFGVGYKFWRHKNEIFSNYNVVICTDNNIDQTCCINGVNICPQVALAVEYDYILVIPSSHKIDIIENLLKRGIPEHKIVP